MNGELLSRTYSWWQFYRWMSRKCSIIDGFSTFQYLCSDEALIILIHNDHNPYKKLHFGSICAEIISKSYLFQDEFQSKIWRSIQRLELAQQIMAMWVLQNSLVLHGYWGIPKPVGLKNRWFCHSKARESFRCEYWSSTHLFRLKKRLLNTQTSEFY